MGSSSSSDSSPWKGKSTIKEPEENLIPDNLYLLESEENSDVVMICGGKKFLAHKEILSAHSETFQSIFENIQETGNVFQIPEVTPSTFKHLLHFLYSGKILKMPLGDSLKLYNAAMRYKVSLLQKKCLKIIQQAMSDDNVCEILQHAESHRIAALKDAVISHLASHEEFFTTERWKEYSNVHTESAVNIMIAACKRKIQK